MIIVNTDNFGAFLTELLANSDVPRHHIVRAIALKNNSWPTSVDKSIYTWEKNIHSPTITKLVPILSEAGYSLAVVPKNKIGD